MAYTFRGDRLGCAPGADLTDKEYHAVTLDSAGKCVLTGANPGRKFQGILVGEDLADGEVGIQFRGIHYAVVGADVAIHQPLVPNASSQLIPGTTGQVSYYTALEAVDTDGTTAGKAVCAVKIGDPVVVP